MNTWLIFLGCGLVTYFSRGSFMLFGDRAKLPAAIQQSLVYVAPATFAAIMVPAVLGADGLGSLTPPSAEVIAIVIAGAATYKTRNMAIALASGMIALWLLQWVGL